jgi:hypothetical protein
MQEITQAEPKMWGDRIVGFGSYSYEYNERRKGEWCLTGFSPLQKTITIYMNIRPDDFIELSEKLGEYTLGTTSIFVIKLEDIDLDILKELIEKSVNKLRKIHQKS